MEFGLTLGPFMPPRDEMSPQDALALEMRFADRAASAGFDYVSMGDHYLSGPHAQFFQPIPLAAAILATHPSLSVATTIYLLPHHNPVEVAEAVATLDALAPGRFVFGVGQGYRSDEAEAVGIENSSRGERLAESIRAMRLLWRGGPSTFDGHYYRFHDADIGIGTADPQGPPILIGADKAEAIVRIPSIGGDHWLPSPRNSVTFIKSVLPAYERAVREAGRNFVGIPLMRSVYASTDEEAAKSALANAAQRMAAIQGKWGQPGERRGQSFDDLRREKQIILGGSEQIAESLIELHGDLAVRCVFIQCYAPGMEPEASLDMVTQLGEESLPLVRKEVGTDSLFFDR
jgi:alkanesulfonate monooxygenase SsuD/methylene tetrahydromethanopterin reductase-like flavin-dependent oxidoreductase (luciferase family)